MPENLHKRASELIAKALEMSPKLGESFILKNADGNRELEELALELYQEVLSDNTSSEKNHKDASFTEGAPSKIGVFDNTSQVVGSLSNLLFGKRINRHLTLGISIALVFLLSLFLRHQFRKSVLIQEGDEQRAMLNVNYIALQHWINLKTELTLNIAKDPRIVNIAAYLDSLVEENPNYDLLRKKENIDPAFTAVNAIRNENQLEALSIINKRDPVFMLLTEQAADGSDNAFEGIQLAKRAYEYYMQLTPDSTRFIPPLHDTEKFDQIPTGLNLGTYCTFVNPIIRNGDLVGYLFNEYNVKNDFSRLLNLTHHKKTAETYAVNLRGRMISESRFTKDLQQSYLLDFDTTKASIFNIKLLDPGVNVYQRKEPKVPQIDQQLTRIVADIYKHIKSENPVYEGNLMKPYRDYRGVPVVGAWKWLPQYNFGLIDEIDSKEALASLRFFDIILLMFFLVLLVLTLLLFNSNVRIVKFGRKMEDFRNLGQYRLLKKIGEGGFGEVYKAEHTFLKTPVAIKLLKKEFIGTDMLSRFEKEVKVTSSLSHPNTVKVYDYGTSDSGQFYYVMEYLNGISLDKIVNPLNDFPLNRALYILLNCCYSLSEAHQKGLVHRDIKPMNVMLCNQGGAYDVVKILDFGLVKNIDTSISEQTQINRIGGTPMFMAPERLRDPYNADQRVDIYAVGALGLYLLSGQYILELISRKMLSGQETLQGNFKQDLIDRSDVPDELKILLEQCVSFDPDKRPLSMEALIPDLENLVHDFPWTRADAQNWWKEYDVYG